VFAGSNHGNLGRLRKDFIRLLCNSKTPIALKNLTNKSFFKKFLKKILFLVEAINSKRLEEFLML
jgi:hypothetical protein